MKIEFNFSSPKIHASISRNARIYEKISFLAKSRFFRKNRVFKRRWNFCKKKHFFYFFLHFQILSHKTKLKGNCNLSLGIYFWQENQMLKDIFLKKILWALFTHHTYFCDFKKATYNIKIKISQAIYYRSLKFWTFW